MTRQPSRFERWYWRRNTPPSEEVALHWWGEHCESHFERNDGTLEFNIVRLRKWWYVVSYTLNDRDRDRYILGPSARRRAYEFGNELKAGAQ